MFVIKLSGIRNTDIYLQFFIFIFNFKIKTKIYQNMSFVFVKSRSPTLGDNEKFLK